MTPRNAVAGLIAFVLIGMGVMPLVYLAANLRYLTFELVWAPLVLLALSGGLIWLGVRAFRALRR